MVNAIGAVRAIGGIKPIGLVRLLRPGEHKIIRPIKPISI